MLESQEAVRLGGSKVLCFFRIPALEYRMTNDEGWNRFAKSFLKLTEYIHSAFDVGRSMLDVRCSSVSLSI